MVPGKPKANWTEATEPVTGEPVAAESVASKPAAAKLAAAASSTTTSDSLSIRLQGKSVVPGVAYAPVVWMREFQLPEFDSDPLPKEERFAEQKAFETATQSVAASLWAKSAATTGEIAEILAVEASLAEDPAFSKEVIAHIKMGAPAVMAVIGATEVFVQKFQAVGGIMAERASDLHDLRNRIVTRLQGLPDLGLPDPKVPSILLASDLSPTDTSSLDPKKFAAVVTELGGPTSHTSILARQAGIPCMVATPGLDQISEGTLAFVDATHGAIATDVDRETAAKLIEQEAQRLHRLSKWRPPGRTQDGHAVPLLANIASVADAVGARENYAEGVGLLRTEMNYLTASAEPSLESQTAWYDNMFQHFSGAKVVVRTVDAGSDKPVPFLALRKEENPALGMRGLRLARIEPQHLSRQLNAIAQAAFANPKTEVWVMAPMVATVQEAHDFTEQCHARGLKGGIMVEVPSVAVLADAFMQVVDFVSIGTNDLAQYVMAADRQSPDLTAYNDAWQPAVLNLVAQVAAAGEAAGVPVSVCGEAAGDPLLACVLVGMGIVTLSMAALQIRQVGSALSARTLEECQRAAQAARAALSPEGARSAARQALGYHC